MRRILKRLVWTMVLGIWALATSSSLWAIEIAEELFVDLDASTLSEGDTVWTNQGTYTNFDAVGSPLLLSTPVPTVYFDGASAFAGQDLAPEGLTGFEATRTIEAWVYNPVIDPEETVVSWGKRGGGQGSNMAFNYGNNGAFGAVGHWGAPDLGWDDNGGAPEAGQWHHLAYTYDAEFVRVYADGELMNEEDMIQYGGLDTHGDSAIAIASQWEGDGTTLTAGLRGNMFISRVRVHDGVLSDEQILANYSEEVADFFGDPTTGLPQPEPKPTLAGLWQFDDVNNLGLDSSDRNNQLTPTDGVDFEADGQNGGAGVFDGFGGMLTSDEIADDLPSDGPYTVAAWIRPEETGARGIVGWGDYGSGRRVNALRTFGDNGFRHYWWGADLDALDDDVFAADIDLDEGDWNHIVALYDGEERSLYLNGELLVADAPGTNNATGNNFAIGRTCTFCGDGEFWSGELDDVAIFNIALSEEQIASVMAGDFSEFLGSGLLGDFNNSGAVDVDDIDLLSAAIATSSGDLKFDLDADGSVGDTDLAAMVGDVLGTWIGDANLDGEFNSGDLVSVFTEGKFETNEAATWASGDWNADGVFNSSDFVAAFSDGGFEVGPKTASAVPEPAGALMLLGGSISLLLSRKRKS